MLDKIFIKTNTTTTTLTENKPNKENDCQNESLIVSCLL